MTEQDGLAFSPFGNCSHCHDAAEGLQAWQPGALNIKMKIFRHLTKEFFEISLSPRFGGKEPGRGTLSAVPGDGEEDFHQGGEQRSAIRFVLVFVWTLGSDERLRASLRTTSRLEARCVRRDLNMQKMLAAWFFRPCAGCDVGWEALCCTERRV